MAKKPGKKEAKKSSSGGLLAWIVAPVLVIAALPTAILLIIGMAPTIVAFLIDRHPSKYTTRAVGYLNFAGCLPYAIDLWKTGDIWPFRVLFDVVAEPLTLLVMYSTAAIGWLILFATPPVVAAYLTVSSEVKEKALKARQKELVANWGRNVRLGAMGAEVDDTEDDEAAAEEEETAVESLPSP